MEYNISKREIKDRILFRVDEIKNIENSGKANPLFKKVLAYLRKMVYWK